MSTFDLGRERASGTFERQQSRYRDQLEAIEPGRYHLYVCYACPWAHRTIIARMLMGLEEAIGMSAVDPFRDERGWAFTGGEYVDPVNGWSFLSEAYDDDFDGRVSVPVLWDKQEERIVNNESADVLRMLGGEVLAPPALRDEIDALNARLYDEVNNAVYKAGFTTKQDVYEREVRGIFAALDDMDARLASSRFLFGDEPLETDWRFFTTLVRFDAVYAVHFKCSISRIVDYEHLWPYLRDLHQWPGVRETVRMDEIRRHYYGTHPQLNPSGLIALQPAADLDAPVDRVPGGGA